MARKHLFDHDSGCFHLGMVTEEPELARIEEHCLGCSRCAELVEEVGAFVETVRTAMIVGDLDLKL